MKKYVFVKKNSLFDWCIIIFLIFVLSCKTTGGKIKCFAKSNKNVVQPSLYQEVCIALEDSLQHWINQDIKSTRNFKRGFLKVDENVFFNSTKNAAILLILKQDTTVNAGMDFIQMIFAKQISNKWHFYYDGMPTLRAERYYTAKKDPKTPYNFTELSGFAIRKIIEGGYFKNCTCKINDDYINEWYSGNLEGQHEDFLKSK